jgi:hypothetical protein
VCSSDLVRTNQDACTSFLKSGDGRKRGSNAAVVAYDSSLHGYVEITTQQNSLAG